MVLGMVLEKFWRNAIGLVVASSLGFVTLIIAHNLALGSDTMVMLQAVLDTNFWLATHVVIVTLGYASTYVAGPRRGVHPARGAHPRTRRNHWTRPRPHGLWHHLLRDPLQLHRHHPRRHLGRPELGPLLGWDPKENGALIIVLWNALLLHARWGGIVRERGLMNLTGWATSSPAGPGSGTNMLGIGPTPTVHERRIPVARRVHPQPTDHHRSRPAARPILAQPQWSNGYPTPASPGPRHVPAAAGAVESAFEKVSWRTLKIRL